MSSLFQLSEVKTYSESYLEHSSKFKLHLNEVFNLKPLCVNTSFKVATRTRRATSLPRRMMYLMCCKCTFTPTPATLLCPTIVSAVELPIKGQASSGPHTTIQRHVLPEAEGLTLEKLSVNLPGRPYDLLCQDLSLQLQPGECAA